MKAPIRVDLPASKGALSALRLGDEVELFGDVFTARDATHQRLVSELEAGGSLPHGLEGEAIFYAGPTPAAAGRPVGSVGPTTARRMDAQTPPLLDAGVAVTIGKGPRGDAVREACARNGAVYLAALGGAAALLATTVVAAEVVAYPELGPEALVRMTLSGFPAIVAIDSTGQDFFARAHAEWLSEG